MKQSADDNPKFYENSQKFSICIENTVGKGEIAHYEQFLLFPECFQKACFPGASKGVIVWEWVKHAEKYYMLFGFYRSSHFYQKYVTSNLFVLYVTEDYPVLLSFNFSSENSKSLALSLLLMTHRVFVDNVDQDQAAHYMQSDL